MSSTVSGIKCIPHSAMTPAPKFPGFLASESTPLESLHRMCRIVGFTCDPDALPETRHRLPAHYQTPMAGETRRCSATSLMRMSPSFSRCLRRLTQVSAPAIFTAAATCTTFAAAGEFQSIFDGRTLAGWDGNPQIWRIEEGAITATISAGVTLPKNEFLFWQGEVHDFELVAEFRLTGTPTANSGIQ